MSSIAEAGTVESSILEVTRLADRLTVLSIGQALVDTLDDMVNTGRIEPQLAMKVVARFDRAISEVLADKVKARLNFKVRARKGCPVYRTTPTHYRAISMSIGSVTTSGRSRSETSTSNWITTSPFKPTRSRS